MKLRRHRCGWCGRRYWFEESLFRHLLNEHLADIRLAPVRRLERATAAMVEDALDGVIRAQRLDVDAAIDEAIRAQQAAMRNPEAQRG